MRVLMLGWDFSPRLSGGVGTACRGLAQALARAELGAEVLFVLPQLRGDEEPEKVRLLASDGAPEARAARAPEPEARALRDEPRAEEPAPPPPAPRSAQGAPTLPTPAEALRLLTIDSPLRPYLSPREYTLVVREWFQRFEPAPARSARVRSARAERAAPARIRAKVEEPVPARRAGTAATSVAAVPVPPYGRTLFAEVERYARSALALVEDESFDVIHAHDWMAFPAGLLLRERTGKPLVVHFHSSEFERRGAEASREVRAIEQAALDSAERVLCVSQASANELRARYALEYAKLRVLHNAFEPPLGARRTKAAKPTVLFAGRLSEQKAPDVFLRAAAQVSAHLPEARFVLAGEGELYPELVALARELGLQARTRFTGFLSGEELARSYAAADVYVLSSAAEPFGIGALEALSLGVPTIVPRGAGVGEVVRSVLRFEPGDERDLADRIVALLTRPALAAQLSAAGVREVKGLRWERPARALRGIYDEIARVAP
jgi:glycosyltransferase involved in cell wall biosynthesis